MVGRAVFEDPTWCNSYSELYNNYMNDFDALYPVFAWRTLGSFFDVESPNFRRFH